MGFLERIQADRGNAESRVIGGVPWRPWDSPYWKFSQGGPVHPSRVIFGQDHALGLPALYSCVRLLAESLASLPIKIYTRNPGGGSAARYTGPSLFDRPSTSANTYDWLYQCMTALLLHGNAWGMITGRDGFGYPTGVDWIPPDMVNVIDDEQQPWNPLRTRVYIYGRLVPDWRNELFHIRAFTVPGRTEGISPLRAFAMTVMSGLETQKYGSDWFSNGGFPPGTFQNKELEVDPDASAQIKEQLTASIRNRQPLVYGRDWEYKAIAVPPAEAQFIETQQMNATMLASVYGLPPDRVGGKRGDSLTYNTVEQSTLQVIEALRPWMVRLETAFFDLLPATRYVRFNSDALLKTDLLTRTNIYESQRDMGLRTLDEIRDQEDLPPLPNGSGAETIPADVMVAMARTIRGIPNSMLNQITLEMDLVADKLESLQTEGVAAPDIEPAAKAPTKFLGQMLGLGRALEQLDPEDAAIIRAIRERHEHRQKKNREPKPEFIGPWIPTDAQLAALAGSNGNGNGHGDN